MTTIYAKTAVAVILFTYLFCVSIEAQSLNPPSRRVVLRQDPNMIEPPLVSSLSQPNNIVFPGNPVPSDPSNLQAAASISTCGCQACPCSTSSSSSSSVVSNTPKGIGSASSCGCNVCPCTAVSAPVKVTVVPRQSLKPATASAACPCASAATGVTILKAKTSPCTCATKNVTATATTVLTNKNATKSTNTTKKASAPVVAKKAPTAKASPVKPAAAAALSPQQKKLEDLKQKAVALATQVATETDASKKAALQKQHAVAVKAYLDLAAASA